MTNGQIIKKSLLSEKGTKLAEKGVYVFAVDKKSSKQQIKERLESLYEVRVSKVRVLNILGKKVRGKGRKIYEKRADWKKAYIHVSSGSIETLKDK